MTVGGSQPTSAPAPTSGAPAEASSAPANAGLVLASLIASAESISVQYPQYSTAIIAGAKSSFLAGDQYAYLAGIIAVLLDGILVWFMFPRRDEERKLLAEYHAHDTEAASTEPVVAPKPVPQPA